MSGQRNSLFKGETLRGLLLSAYAWSTVGMIAGLGLIHRRRTTNHEMALS